MQSEELAVIPQPLTVTEILSQVVMSDVPDKIGAMERLIAMQRQMSQDEAERQFNDAMNRCQLAMGRIATNMDNPSTRSRYADYSQIDRAIRPIYTKEGFSLSFGDGETPGPDMVRIICYVSRGGHTRIYRKDMPVVTKGPKGNDVMTATHATGSADAYAKRYLVKDIFNLAIGEDDDDGNLGALTPEQTAIADSIRTAPSEDEVLRLYKDAYRDAFLGNKPAAGTAYMKARTERLAELAKGAA